jgi:tetratricopeptide (TPR) repeat protein
VENRAEAGPDEGVGAAALRRLVFIEMPAVLVREIGNFRPDPSIPIPVETGRDAHRFDPADLTWESIVAGMLRLLAWRPDHEHAAYYRAFVKAVKPGILEELSEAGIIKARNKDWEIAEEIFRALAGLYPDAPEPLIDLAVMYEDRAEAYTAADKGDLAEAMDERAFAVYKTLLAMEPPFPAAYFNAGFFFLRRRSYERARSLFQTYAQIGDDEDKVAKAKDIAGMLGRQGYLDELFKEAYDLIRMQRDEEGLEKARSFVKKNPNVWNGWFLVGWAERRLGRWEEGRAAFEKALELGAEGSDVLNELSICLSELGRLEEARARLERALRLEPENVKIITNLGALAAKRGRKTEAAGFFRAALDIEPDDEMAKRWLATLGAEDGGA